MQKLSVKVLKLKQFPIHELLKLEESLLRTPDAGNWLILNEGTSLPCIVMGSGTRVPKTLINVENVIKDDVKVVKRFTGGGTVFVDHDSLFASFVLHHSFVSQCVFPNLSIHQHKQEYKAYPADIMRWTEGFYKILFDNHYKILPEKHQIEGELEHERKQREEHSSKFSLRENDYVFGDLKFGGNAQYITGGRVQRFVHHTSFLWNYKDSNMEQYLTLPDKRPDYRKSRTHRDFLCKLSERVEPKHEVDKSRDGKQMFLQSIEKTFVDLCVNDWSHCIESVEDFNDVAALKAVLPANYAETAGTKILDEEMLLPVAEKQ